MHNQNFQKLSHMLFILERLIGGLQISIKSEKVSLMWEMPIIYCFLFLPDVMVLKY